MGVIIVTEKNLTNKKHGMLMLLLFLLLFAAAIAAIILGAVKGSLFPALSFSALFGSL